MEEKEIEKILNEINSTNSFEGQQLSTEELESLKISIIKLKKRRENNLEIKDEQNDSGKKHNK